MYRWKPYNNVNPLYPEDWGGGETLSMYSTGDHVQKKLGGGGADHLNFYFGQSQNFEILKIDKMHWI